MSAAAVSCFNGFGPASAQSWQACFDAAGEGRQTLILDTARNPRPNARQFAEQGACNCRMRATCAATTVPTSTSASTCQRADPAMAQRDAFQPETGGRDVVIFRHHTERPE